MVDLAIPTASTGTTAPNKALQIKGVMKMAPTVVAVVINTLKATLPLAMYVHKLDACPPLMLPTKTMPANKAGLNPNPLANPKARMGIMA